MNSSNSYYTWLLLLEPASPWWILVAAIGALAVRSFVDGVHTVERSS